MSNPVSEAFEAWKAKVIAEPGYVDPLVADALERIIAKRLSATNIDEQIEAATDERDEVKGKLDTAESTLAGMVGQTTTVTGTTAVGSDIVTGSFTAAPLGQGGWAQHANLRAGSIVTDWSTTALTLSRPAKIAGTVSITITTGSLAVTDAQIARLTAQAADLQDQLDDILNGETVLDKIEDGRTALVAAGHHLAPRTVLRSAPGAALTVNQTTNLQAWLTAVPAGTSGSSNWAHLWRGVVYRSDGTLELDTRSDLNLDFHGSPLTAGATGGATRDHLRLTDCTRVLVRPVIRGSLPTGNPAYSATYTGQHGVQILGGSAITIDKPDISDVLTSGIRIGAGTAKPNGVTIQGIGSVTRCGNHVLAVAACDALEWKRTDMGSSGRETIAVSPGLGVVCNDVNLHDFAITGAVSDGAYTSISARSSGKVTTFKLDTITAQTAHGPLTADISATTSEQKGTDLRIIGNVGAGIMPVNTDRCVWKVAHYTGVQFSNNSQAMARSGGKDVMYGLKGTDIDGTIVVGGNSGTQQLGQALIDNIIWPKDSTNPNPVTELTVGTVTNTTIPLTWTAATDNVGGSGIAGYNVYTVAGSPEVETEIGVVTDPAFTAINLTQDTTYKLRVKARDNAGNYSTGKTVTQKTTVAADTTAPTPPTSLAATSTTSSGTTLGWVAGTDAGSGVKGYNVYKVVGTTDTPISTGTPSGVSFPVTGLTASTPYTFKVETEDNSGNKSTKTSVDVTTSAPAGDTTDPTKPTNLKAPAKSDTTVKLSWTASTDTGGSGLDGYVLTKLEDDDVTETDLATPAASPYTVKNLTADTTYRFRLRAKDGAGNVSGPVGIQVKTNDAPVTGTLDIASPTTIATWPEDVDITDITFTASGGVAPLTWSWAAATGSSTPPGASFSSGGVLSTGPGGPTTPGTYTVDVTVTDSTSGTAQTKTKQYVIIVSAASTFAIDAPTTIPAFTKDVAIDPIQFTTANADGAVTWSKTGTLPAGLRWDLTGTNKAKLRGTPTAAESQVVTFKAVDSHSPTPNEAEHEFTIVVGGLAITNTTPLPAATVGVPYSITFAASGGVGTLTWTTVSGKPSWLTKTGATYAGTPAAGDITTGLTLTVKVVDSSTPAQQDQEAFVLVVGAAGVGYYDRRIGFCTGSATDAMIKFVGTRIAAGTNRLDGGLIRLDIGGVQMGGGANPTLNPNGPASSQLDAIASTGAKAMALNGYSFRDDQRTLTFQGSTAAGNKVNWNGGVGTGLASQAGVPGIRPASLRDNNMVFDEMSIHGPGIAYLRKFSGSTKSGGDDVFYCTLPTGDNPGSGVGADWVGCGISGPGIPAGTKIASPGPVSGGLKLSQAASGTQATNAGYTIGKFVAGKEPAPWQVNQPKVGPASALDMTGGVTAGKSGTYRIGGTNALGDTKMMTADPMDAERIAAATVTQGGNRIGVVEGWNEVAWPLGQRPFTDVALGCRIFAHQYVGMKVAAQAAGRDVHYMFPGTGMVNDVNPRFPTFLNAQEWYDACLDFYLNKDPNYFTQLCAARGVTKNIAPQFPGDILAMHPYGQGIEDANNMGMNQCAYVYNTVGEAAGYLPFAIVEQGLEWTPDGSGTDNQGRPNLDAAEAYRRYLIWIDIMHGNRPWPYKTKLNGPAAGVHLPNAATDSSTGITVATRRAKMLKAHGCPCWFSICTPFGAHGELGIGWEFGGTQKYVIGTNDPLRAMEVCD